MDTDITLRLVGHVNEQYRDIPGVEQIPFVPIDELICQIVNARFCVLPLEPFNYSYGQMTLMQQMALGKCVIAAKVPSLVDYIEDGETAVMYDPCNVTDLAEKMKLLNENKSLRLEIAQRGKQFLKGNCCERIMAEEIEGFFGQFADS